MRDVALLGVGQTPVGEHWETSLTELAAEACLAAMNHADLARPDLLVVGNMLAASPVGGQLNLGAKIADWCGLGGLEAYRTEAACGSGAAAFRCGTLAVASGEVDTALVVGVEKMSHASTADLTAALASAADADHEVTHGASFVALNALLMRRYMHEFGWSYQDFAPFPITAHANARDNPFAHFREPIAIEDYLQGPVISEPIRLFDCSPTGDGAAAILLGSLELARRGPTRPLLLLRGMGAATDTLAIHDRQQPLRLEGVTRSAKGAFRGSGLGPKEVDFVEPHDAFSIMAVMSLEASGFCELGQGPRLGLEGQIRKEGRLPITTMGGLKARGHPVGASGAYQIVEAALQLWGEAGANQVDLARIGMVQSIGGSGAAVFTHLLARA